MKLNKVFFLAAILIVVTSAFGFVLFFEKVEHVKSKVSFSVLIATIIGIFGYIGWRSYYIKWPLAVWVMAYVTYILFISGVTLINIYVMPIPVLKATILRVGDIFNSPMLFLGLYLLAKSTAKDTPAQTKQRRL